MSRAAEDSQPLLASGTVDVTAEGQLGLTAKHRALWTLPLVVITYFLSYYTAVFVRSPYLYDQVAEKLHFKKNSSSQHPCSNEHANQTNSSQHAIEDKIQKELETLNLYMSFSSYLCAAISILLVGPLMDKYGRKLGFIIPIIGTILKQIVYAITIALNLSPMVLIAGHIFESIGGSFAAALTAMFTVVSDVSMPGPRRSLFIAIMEAVHTLTAASDDYLTGQWVRHSFLQPILFSLACGVVSLILTLLLLPETVHRSRVAVPTMLAYSGCCQWLSERGRSILIAAWQKFKRSFLLFIRDQCEGNHILAKRRLCLMVFVLTVAVNFSSAGVQGVFLMKSPRCWPMYIIQTFGSIQMVCNWVTILFLLVLLQKVFKVADRQVAIIGVVSSLASAVFMSLAINDVMIYEAAVLGVMVRSIIPMLRSVQSSLVSASDQGAIYASLGCVEVIGTALFGTLTNRLYYYTLSTWDGAVYIMFAGLMAVALVLLIILNILFMRDQPLRQQSLQHSNNYGSIQRPSDTSW